LGEVLNLRTNSRTSGNEFNEFPPRGAGRDRPHCRAAATGVFPALACFLRGGCGTVCAAPSWRATIRVPGGRI
jgi:hypothetical protein